MGRYTKNIVICLFVLCLVSCMEKDVRKPLIHKVETIQAVMIDLYVADQALDKVKEIRKDSLRSLYRSQIETIHGIKLDEIERDMETIKSNPKWYFDVHIVVKDSIASLQSKSQNATKGKDRAKKIEEEIKKAAAKKN